MINRFHYLFNPNETIQDVRERLLGIIFKVISIIGFPVMIVALIEAVMLDQYLPAVLYGFMFSAILLVTVFQKRILNTLLANSIDTFR